MKNTNKKIRFKVGDQLVGKKDIRNNTWLRIAKNKWEAMENHTSFCDDNYVQQMIDVPTGNKIYDFVPAPSRKRNKKPQAKAVVKQQIRFFRNTTNKFRYIFIGNVGICLADYHVFISTMNVDSPSLVEYHEFPQVLELLRNFK